MIWLSGLIVIAVRKHVPTNYFKKYNRIKLRILNIQKSTLDDHYTILLYLYLKRLKSKLLTSSNLTLGNALSHFLREIDHYHCQA